MAPRAGLLLTPGASATRTSPALVAIDDAVSGMDVAVERLNFPYTEAGRRAPDRPPVLLQAVRDGAARLCGEHGLSPRSVFLGGRSMGGRMCSMAAAEGLATRGLVLVSYPLHPPGRRDQLRTAHFPQLDVPCLFVSGTKDTFGTPDELEQATEAIPGEVTHFCIVGGDHGHRRTDGVVAAAVAAWMKPRLPRRLR
jgi:predicted alpha/beta-hydrolase family hydrolase